VIIKYDPTLIPAALLTVMLVDPFVAPLEMEGFPLIDGFPIPKETTAPEVPWASRIVLIAPLPRRVTLLGIRRPLLIRNVPDERETTWFAGQLLSAAWMPAVASDAPFP